MMNKNKSEPSLTSLAKGTRNKIDPVEAKKKLEKLVDIDLKNMH